MRSNTTQHNTTQHNTTQHNTTQHNTTQHNTTQHNTTQHNIAQRNAAQHSKAGFPLENFFARSEFFFCLYPISCTWFQLRDQRQIKNSLRAKKFASGKPA